MSDTLERTLHGLAHFISRSPLGTCYSHPHFTDEEIRAQINFIICVRLPSLDLTPGNMTHEHCAIQPQLTLSFLNHLQNSLTSSVNQGRRGWRF